jgi:sugar lactone lactonase YvrE
MTARYWISLLVGLVGAAPALAQTPTTGSWPDAVRQLRAGKAHPRQPARRIAPVAAIATSTVAESEPNDSIRTADSAALGDQATGVVDPASDVDTWFIDLTAGQFFSADVDAANLGSPLDATLVLFGPDRSTVVASNDDFDGADSRVSYHVPTSGRYFVMVSSFGRLGGGPGARYRLNLGLVDCAAVGTEQEPNDAPGTATLMAIGESGTGQLCSQNAGGDVDYWAFAGQAGTTIELDIDAASSGLLVDPFVALFASDGTTRLAFNDDGDGADSRLQFSIVTTGTYFVAVTDVAANGGNPFPYTLHVRSIVPGPGDPITLRADGLIFPLGLAVGSTGDLFVGDVAANRVARVSVQGVVTTFAEVPNPLGLAFDAAGDLLVVSLDGAVYRVTPQGQATRFITDAGFAFWIAVAPDGRIWLTDVSDRSLRRYSSTGQFETRFDAIAVGGSGPGPLAIGPAGEPYFSQGTEIWKLSNGELQRVFADGAVMWAFAFDVAGNVYVPSPVTGRIKLFDPAGTPLADPFAIGPDAPQAVAFGRDGTGATVARVFATEPRIGRVIEVNPAAVAHRGLPVGFAALFTAEAAATALLGGGDLSAANRQFLDGLGNRNGRYDVGDFQAYLRSLNGLPVGRAP